MDKRSIYALLIVLGGAGFEAGAVPASPKFFSSKGADGTTVTVKAVGDEFFHYYQDKDGTIYTADTNGELAIASVETLELRRKSARKAAASGGARKINTSYPAKGESRALVILVNFADNQFTIPNPRETYIRMLNEPGFSEYGATGSVKDYFLASSKGQFDPTFDVYGPVTLPGTMAYYGAESFSGHDTHPEEMVINACIQLDADIDFSIYDRDKDGEIDNVYIFYAGRGQASGGSPDTIWPHSSDVFSGFKKTHRFDGVLLNHYACSNEIDESLSLAGIGTFCHEFSHVLGLPDLYPTSYTDAFTCGRWSVMDYGPYCNNGHTPPLYSAFERYSLKWLEPEMLADKPLTVCMPPIDENKAYMLPTERDGEYFLFENRQQTGWDKYIPGHGMLVWHIDFHQGIWNNNSVNNNPSHLYVDILEADNIRDEQTRAGDSFPGTAGITKISDETTPGLLSWEKNRSGKDITEIREIDGNIYFEYCGGNPPLLSVTGFTVKDITSKEAKVTWQPVADADGYEFFLSAMVGEEEIPVGGFDGLDMKSETSCELTGLDYSTDYKGYVVAYNRFYRSLAGEGFSFTTDKPSFSQLKPASPEIKSVSAEGCSLVCPLLENAISYEFSIFKRSHSESEKDMVDFSDDTWKERGWKSSSSEFYNTTAYSGNGAPSLKLTTPGDEVSSPDYPADINELSFWHRATSNSENNKVRIDIFDKNRQKVSSVEIASSRKSGGHLTVLSENIDTPVENLHARSFKIVSALDNASLAIDDISVEYGMKAVDKTLFSKTSETSSADFDGLEPATSYMCKVRAFDADNDATLWSDPVIITTSKASGITDAIYDPNSSDNTILYDLHGRRVKNPEATGIYITSDKRKVIK